MKTERIIISNTGENLALALRTAEEYTEEAGLSGKPALHLRLLAEETVGMVKSLSGQFTAYFWIEKKRGKHEIHLEGKITLDSYERETLLSVAKSGGNLLAKGIMGKIKNLLEIGALNYKEVGKDSILDYGVVLPTDPDAMLSPGVALGMTEQFWSLQSYRKNMAGPVVHEDPEEVREALDELERSIVANLADDVQVGVLDGKLLLVVVYDENR